MRRFPRALFFAVVLGLQAGAPAALKPAKPIQPAPLHEAGPAQVAPGELDRSIDRVLARREYAWRLPRRESDKEDKSWLRSWYDSLARWFNRGWKALRDLADKIREWIRTDANPEDGSKGFSMAPVAAWALYVLLGVAVAMLGWLAWRRRQALKDKAISATAAEAVPDLHSEDVLADQLPEARWLQLARELFERGELRLSLRASYLAGLSHLGQRELLAIARYKTNLDYRRELNRRAAQRRELLGAFEENVRSFESVWYGREAVTPEVVSRFSTNLDVIRAGAGVQP